VADIPKKDETRYSGLDINQIIFTNRIAMTSLSRLRQKKIEQTILNFKKQLRQNYRATPGPFSYIIILDNLKLDFNIGKIYRSADALGAREIHLIGTPYFDPSPAKGALKWIPTHFHDDFASCHRRLTEQGYIFHIMSPEAAISLQESVLPQKTAFAFGHEEFGFSFNPDDFPDLLQVKITQYGKVQSLNVSVAASMAMYEYTRQHGNFLPASTK